MGRDRDWWRPEIGFSHCMALKTDGSLWTWGDNRAGQCGDGSISARLPLPMNIGTDIDWTNIAAGADSSWLIKRNGTLWGFGWATSSFNPGAPNAFKTPKQIRKWGFNWKIISASNKHVLALRDDNTLWAWGNNRRGQLGNGKTTNTNEPIQVGEDFDWQTVRAGHEHTLAIKVDGSLWAWGSNQYGQCGDGARRAGPKKIIGLKPPVN